MQRVQHHCEDEACCRGYSREVCIDIITSVLHKAWFDALGSYLPSTTRWYTLEPSLILQTGGMLCHGILTRVLLKLFDVKDDDALERANASAWVVHANQKMKHSIGFMTDQPATLRVLSNALLVTEPLDKLSARLQHLDDAGHSLRELMMEEGPAFQCQRHIWSLLNPWSGEHHAYKSKCMLRHLEGFAGMPIGHHQERYDEMRALSLDVGFAVASRMQWPTDGWPLKLMRGWLHGGDSEAAVRCLEEFIAANE